METAKTTPPENIFKDECHQLIWLAMGALYPGPIDMITLYDKLHEYELLEKVGGPEYLCMVLDAAMKEDRCNCKPPWRCGKCI